MIKYKNKKVNIIIILLIIVVLNLVAMIWFNNLVFNELETSAKSSLEEMAEEQSRAIALIIENKQDNVKGIVDVITYIGNNPGTLDRTMEIWTKEFEIETIIITDIYGKGITSTGEIADISKEEFFSKAALGEISMTNVYDSKYTGNSVLGLSAPIYYGGHVQGVIVTEYNVIELASLLMNATDSRGSSMIVNSEGEILIHTYPFPISFENFQTATFEEGKTYESILNDFANSVSGDVTFTIMGDRKLGEYIPLGIEDWTLFFEISESAMSESADTITTGMIVISVCLLLAFSALIFYILWARKKSVEEIEKVAYYDELTGVSNLIKFKLDMNEIISRSDFNASKYVLIKGDIDNFKVINEVYGIDVGDRVIKQVVKIAHALDGEFFQIARTGSDEMLVFAERDKVDAFFKVRHGFIDALKTEIPEVEKHFFNFRYGRYFLEPDEKDIDEMIIKVSIAHSYARAKTGWAVWDYDEKFKLHMLRMTELTNKMEDSLHHEEFKMFLQPKYCPRKNEIVGAEALVRWIEDDGKMIYPNEFIPLFEKNEFITTIDKYIFESACKLISKRLEQGLPCVPISANFSRRHLQNPKFVNSLSTIAKKHNTPTKYLEIELTETAIIDNVDILHQVLSELHEAGFSVSIDDFGSGYSSLGMLKSFNFDVVKLDRSFFVTEEEERDTAKTVLEGIIQLISSIGSKIVAEGIEYDDQVEFLRTVECYAIQGYYYAKPMSSDDFEKLMDS